MWLCECVCADKTPQSEDKLEGPVDHRNGIRKDAFMSLTCQSHGCHTDTVYLIIVISTNKY